jgi:hypothetical protein
MMRWKDGLMEGGGGGGGEEGEEKKEDDEDGREGSGIDKGRGNLDRLTLSYLGIYALSRLAAFPSSGRFR